MSELAAKYPLLGDIPVLGLLFRSQEFQKQETELVILVTPRLVKPLDPGKHPLPTDHYIEPNDFEFYLLGWLEGRGDGDASTGSSAGSDTAGGLIGESGHRMATAPEGEF
jgi:pilus assembly protein CpaC